MTSLPDQPADPASPSASSAPDASPVFTGASGRSSIGGGTSAATPRQISSEFLLQGDKEIQILHGSEVYRLSVTRQGKLILHK